MKIIIDKIDKNKDNSIRDNWKSNWNYSFFFIYLYAAKHFHLIIFCSLNN